MTQANDKRSRVRVVSCTMCVQYLARLAGYLLRRDACRLVCSPRAQVDLQTTPANKRKRNVGAWRRSNEPRHSREVVHHRAASHRAVERALCEEARHVFWLGRYEVHAHALAERLCELSLVDNLVVDAQAASPGAD